MAGFPTRRSTLSRRATARSNSSWPASSYDFQNTNNDPQNVINVKQRREPPAQMDLPNPGQPLQHPRRPARSGDRGPAARRERHHLHRDAVQPHHRAQRATGQLSRMVLSGEHDQVHRGEVVVGGLCDKRHLAHHTTRDALRRCLRIPRSTPLMPLDGTMVWTIPPVAANIEGNTGTYYGEKAPILVGDNLIVRASTTDYGGRGFRRGVQHQHEEHVLDMVFHAALDRHRHELGLAGHVTLPTGRP